jgi:hypothetical protein
MNPRLVEHAVHHLRTDKRVQQRITTHEDFFDVLAAILEHHAPQPDARRVRDMVRITLACIAPDDLITETP